jgi:hypothetical protein
VTDDPLTAEDRVTLARLLKRTLDASRFPLRDESRELRAILEKLEPPREKKPLPPPLPSGRSGVLESRNGSAGRTPLAGHRGVDHLWLRKNNSLSLLSTRQTGRIDM